MNRSEKIVASVSVVALLLSAMLIYSAYAGYTEKKSNNAVGVDLGAPLKRDLNKLSPILEVKAYDSNGNLKQSVVKDDDLIVNNFLAFLKAMLTNHGGSTVFLSMNDTSGASQSLYFWSATHGNSMWDTGSGAKHSYIQIGTGNTAPTRNDKSIQTSAETAVEISAPSYSSGNISFSASIAITGTKDITESVMYSTYEEWVGNTNKAFVMFRDTFSPISVVNGDSVTVTYYLSLTNTSFTDTFGEILAYVWTGTGSSGSLSATGLTDITNTAQTAYVYSTAQTNVMFDTGSAGSNILLQIGTGNTAATRADYVIQTPVETAVGTSVPSYSNGNVSLSGVVTTTASRSVTEAGLYIEVKNTAGTDVQLMLWRAVFSAVAVPSGGQITVTFTVDT